MIYLILCILLLTGCSNSEYRVKEGDVVFQTSQSTQSPLISKATNSPITHCGIVIIKNDTPYVLETSKVIKLTPLNDFINKGKNKKIWIKRVTEDSIKINYEQYLGIPYDLSFSECNDKFYCSELVYHIYKTQFNIELCEYKPISSFNISNFLPLMLDRNIDINSKVITPVDLFNSKMLCQIN